MPVDAAVTVVGEPMESNCLTCVDWNGQTVMMFTGDLLERAEQIAD